MAVALPWVIAGVGTLAAAMQAKSASDSASYNSKVAGQNAQMALDQGNVAADMQAQKAARLQGTSIAEYGASGVQLDNGSAADVLMASARAASMDNLMIKYNAKLRAMGYQNQSQLDDMSATNYRTAGYLGAASSFMKLMPAMGA